ncbi:calpain-5-like isoform X1 [Hippoglossus hippoglossus]|uniref:calpain-5-like isoform X1 n=1 Tax=Hippoglossus hippoglossus TaxID=8267 RepID=UPI00148DFEC4|nr:calpain-5-like isoform X1 [Hippoglossus hippoglossus]XP_034425075.1 calpain-5-like isoform X1 [Hippoglossus hippoglossus]XP_034425076.1 calpain-5-like isoform X1 [Hippoglossus hippoglossus]XP_034425077.1 calpain-5-like isoform X1 [Hippoglossus hippoglossus]
MPERVSDFQGQSFHKLRRDCLRRGALFKDPLFPATAQSLFYKREPPPGLTWKRPREICKDPRLFVDGISTRDLHQGSLGNCWMVAAISCLASEPSLWKKVIPDHVEQEWNPKRTDLYAGIFHFRFWRLGRWMDVVVDDRLPVSGDGVLLFCRSATPREFWSALLEKAYAKLNSCYEALEGGNTAEALIDFTGGVSEPLGLDREALGLGSDHRRTFFQTLAKAHERKALITCSIRPAEGETVESVLDCGLVRGHAYGITAVKKVRLGERQLKTGGASRLFMVRMRNPWGTTDWTGAWSQRSQQWQQMSRAEREKMGLVVRDVGEFWMDFQDFCHYFTDVVVCRLVERALLWPSSHWREVRCYGEWAPAPNTPGSPPSAVSHSSYELTPGKNNMKPGGPEQRGNRKEARLGESQQGGRRGGRRDRAAKKVMEDEDGGEGDGGWTAQVDKRSRCGGCINHRETFLHNPQFMFEVGAKGEEVLICLQQEDRRVRRKDGGGDNLPIGFEVLKVEVNRCSRVQCVVEQAASSVYMDSRSVTLRATLATGRYVVLPTTFLPGATGRFLLRLFSHSHVSLRELKEDFPPPSLFQCFLPQPTVVTSVHLRRASGLSPPKETAPDVYAVVRCENDVIRTRVFKAEGNPEFNLRTLFYRRRPDTHISIELWGRGLLWDSLLGVARLQTAESERTRSHVIDVRGGQSGSGCRGCVHVETSSSVCLTDL